MRKTPDARSDDRSLLQYIIEDVIGDGYKTLQLDVYSMAQIQKNPDALPIEEYSYMGSSTGFEQTIRDERNQCFLFNMSLKCDVLQIVLDTEASTCSIKAIM